MTKFVLIALACIACIGLAVLAYAVYFFLKYCGGNAHGLC